MQRKIAFRAWDKEKKEMLSWNDLQNNQVGFVHSLIGEGNWIVMQSTGLLDKNGKEIFEGDIIEWRYINAWQRNEVKWVHGSFVSIMTAFEDDLNEMQNISLISELDCKVIGNIYENPELLKGESL